MATISERLKKKIEAWLSAGDRNEYGDPPGTVYAGGTPLFDERTGRNKDRYAYILERHPELAKGEDSE